MTALPKRLAEEIAKKQAEIDRLRDPAMVAFAEKVERIADLCNPHLIGWWHTSYPHACLYVNLDRVEDATPILRAIRQEFGWKLRKRHEDADKLKIVWDFAGFGPDGALPIRGAQVGSQTDWHVGLSLRDYFAAQCLCVLANKEMPGGFACAETAPLAIARACLKAVARG